ncbi:MAG TPA: NUDIX domain-containing protein [Candidatus Sulfotelmatobacter sp.]|nr:NUDIX domain-containing protein [Candidatus Sulfotelmatobacter sp.]
MPGKMAREISAGGVVLRSQNGTWWMAAIELPEDSRSSAPNSRRVPRGPKPTLCLPKGLVDPGEKALDAAQREVREETGVTAELVEKLGDIKYVYLRSWGDRQKVFKIVSFYLLRYQSGRIDDVTPEMRIEVARACWIPLQDAPKLLAYKGEKEMARRAIDYVATNPDLVPKPAHVAGPPASHPRKAPRA